MELFRSGARMGTIQGCMEGINMRKLTLAKPKP